VTFPSAPQRVERTLHVADDKGLLRVRWWAQGVAFDSTKPAVNVSAKPAVALLRNGAIVAGIVCSTPWLQRSAELILEATLIRRDETKPEGAK
jgi:hypothetical protein